MTIETYIKQSEDLLNDNLTDFLDGATVALNTRNFDKLVSMLRTANIPNIDEALDPLLEDSLEFYVRYIFDSEDKDKMHIDEYIEKLCMPFETHLSKNHNELVDWITRNSNKIHVNLDVTSDGIYMTKQ